MQRIVHFVLIGLIAIAAIWIRKSQATASDEDAIDSIPVEWRTNFDAARAEATARGIPLVIFFKAANSYFDVRYEQMALENPKVAYFLNERCVPLRIDTWIDMTLANALKIDRFPTTIYATPAGDVSDQVIGLDTAENVFSRLHRIQEFTHEERNPGVNRK